MKRSMPPSVLNESPRATSAPQRVQALLALLFVCAVCVPSQAQTNQPARKLPAPERVVADYLKAVGGKARLRALRDATYEWLVELPDGTQAHARTLRKAPDAVRTDIFFARGETNSAANARTAWRR